MTVKELLEQLQTFKDDMGLPDNTRIRVEAMRKDAHPVSDMSSVHSIELHKDDKNGREEISIVLEGPVQ